MQDRRKELKLRYKQNPPPPMGVYQIKNRVNGKIFIATSMNLAGRQNSYMTLLEFNSNYNNALKDDLKSHGADAFSFEILETIDADKIPKENWREAVLALEEKWLENLQPYGEKGYNKPKKVNTKNCSF